MHMVPLGPRLHTEPLQGGELALDAEQMLDEGPRLLVASLAKWLPRMMSSASTK
ncbi:hypothetical protein [Streptomyces mirabilis]|uniref:hypothetical protein n=2 Tax=Streptomyces mirabilis TaxID=68239 RepID=UPI0036DD3E47